MPRRESKLDGMDVLPIEVAEEEKKGPNWKIIGVILVLGALVVLWFNGTFDEALYPWGLNAKDCAQNFFGNVFCGDDLVKYCETTQARGCGEVLD